MKTFKLMLWGEEKEFVFKKEKYFNKNICVQVLFYDKEFEDWEPWVNLTTNFETKNPDGLTYLDVNNCNQEIIRFCEENGLIEYTGKMMPSGFCVYPQIKITNKLNDYLLQEES